MEENKTTEQNSKIEIMLVIIAVGFGIIAIILNAKLDKIIELLK